MYNAYEKDIAMLNIYFGGSTVFGKKTKQEKAKILLEQHFSQSLRDRQR